MIPSARRCAVLVVLMLWCAAAADDAWASRTDQAETLYRQALAFIAGNSIESRQQARDCLERATLLAPNHAEYELELGRVYYRMGFLKMARRRFERVESLHPDNAEARTGLGLVWRRDYLKYLDRGSLERSIEQFTEAARLEPRDSDAWLNLVALLVEKPNLRAALAAAERARDADRSRPEGLLALGHVAYRLGQVERADSAFRSAVPRLLPIVRQRFEDIAPVATEHDTATLRRLPLRERGEFVRRFWKEHDPDLATIENEAQLEYWSRVTQAYLLFFNARRREWDQRGEVYVRYGPPQKAEYNPVGAPNRYHAFPMNVLVWSYPALGMDVQMQDRLLSEYYLRPVSLTHDTDPAPNPDSLERRHDALPTGGGRGVFPMLPPGAKSLPVDGTLARFEGEAGPRLMALFEAPGAPKDSLWAEWVVLDSTRHEVARARQTLGPSACDPAELRMADFVAELPPGAYLAGISVRNRSGARGLFRSSIDLAPISKRLELSDIVVSCGGPGVEPGTPGQPPAVRLVANPGARVDAGDPLTVYFEMYHLAPDAQGRSRVEFEYTVRNAARDERLWFQRLIAPRRPLPEIAATRREEQTGSLRRQFVTVPVQALPIGRYRLEVKVRDLNAGTEAVRNAEFVRLGAGPPGS